MLHEALTVARDCWDRLMPSRAIVRSIPPIRAAFLLGVLAVFAAWVARGPRVLPGPVPRYAVVLEVESPRPGFCQVYFDTGAGFTELGSVPVPLVGNGQWQRCVFPIPTSPVTNIRLDPVAGDATVRLRHTRIEDRWTGEALAVFDTTDSIQPLHDIAGLSGADGVLTIVPDPGARDPHLLLPHPAALSTSTAPDDQAGRHDSGPLRAGGVFVAVWLVGTLCVYVLWRLPAPDTGEAATRWFPALPRRELWTLAALTALRVWLGYGWRLVAYGDAVHDDFWFIRTAAALLDLDWLGSYSHLTLCKGPGYPLWIALSSALEVPLLISHHVLYVGAALLLYFAIRPLMHRRWVGLAVYFALLINPAALCGVRALRSGLYTPLVLLVTAAGVGFATRCRDEPRILRRWAAAWTVALVWFWLTREEGPWMLPAVACAGAAVYFTTRELPAAGRCRRLLLATVPLAGLVATLLLVSTINWRCYGVFQVVEFKTDAFRSAVGSLMRISEPLDPPPHIPVLREARMRAYAVSPACAELAPFLEGGIGAGWRDNAASGGFSAPWGEIPGGWFVWAIRDAAAAAGYHADGPQALEFYDRVAAEVNEACDAGRVPGGAEWNSLATPPRLDFVGPVLSRLRIALGRILASDHDNDQAVAGFSSGLERNQRLYEDITHTTLSQPPGHPMALGSYPLQQSRLMLRYRIANVAAVIFRALLALSVLGGTTAWCANALRSRGRLSPSSWLALGILGSVLLRLLLLCYIDFTSFPGLEFRHLAPMFAPLVVFGVLALHEFDRQTAGAYGGCGEGGASARNEEES